MALQLDPKMIKLNQDVPTRDQAIRMAGQLLVDGGCVEPEYIDSMLARNEDVSTYMVISSPSLTELTKVRSTLKNWNFGSPNSNGR